MDEEVLENLERMPPVIRRHLAKVYFSLLCISASSAFGSYLGSTGSIDSLFALFGAILSSVCFYRLAPSKQKIRLNLLVSAAFFGWAYLAPKITRYLRNDFLAILLLATAVGYGCFWAAFMRTRNVHFLFIRSMLASAVTIPFGCYWAAFMWTRNFELLHFRYLLLCSVMAPACLNAIPDASGCNLFLWMAKVYIMVLLLMVFLAVYSQVVARKVREGDNDYVKHAIRFYPDTPGILSRIMTNQPLLPPMPPQQ